jgi:3-oxoacyl-[acyl-carrier-protein] synthase III
MFLSFNGKKITDLVAVVPRDVSHFVDELDQYSFSREKSLKLKEIMGFDEHRIAPDNTTASDLCEFGFNYLVKNDRLNPDTLDSLIFISHTPDHFIPPTSSILHGSLVCGKIVCALILIMVVLVLLLVCSRRLCCWRTPVLSVLLY